MRRRASDISPPKPVASKPKAIRYLIIQEFEVLYNSWRPIPPVYNIGLKPYAWFYEHEIKIIIYRILEE